MPFYTNKRELWTGKGEHWTTNTLNTIKISDSKPPRGPRCGRPDFQKDRRRNSAEAGEFRSKTFLVFVSRVLKMSEYFRQGFLASDARAALITEGALEITIVYLNYANRVNKIVSVEACVCACELNSVIFVRFGIVCRTFANRGHLCVIGVSLISREAICKMF